nr:hypothetical protein [Tanacetum cinerariifolium]
MVACLEKTEANYEFHKIVDFLTSSTIHHALTQIHATVDSKALVVSEASIRSSLLFNDADGTACLTNESIFQNLALMVYEGELNKLTFQKALFSPQWKYLIHTILRCLSSKSTSWNKFSTNIASTVICLARNQKFNFSKLIFDGMLRNLDNLKKKFLMYPRFLMVFLNIQIKLCEPFNDVYIARAHNLKVFSNMSRKGLKFSGKITPLFPNMLIQEKGKGSGAPTEPQPTPSPTHPSTGDQPPVTESSSSHDTTQDSRDSLEGTNGSEGDQELFSICTNLSNRVLALETVKDAQAVEIIALKARIKKIEKKCKPSISHHRAWLKSVQSLSLKKRFGKKEFVSKQGRKKDKPEPTLDDSTFDGLDADHGMDYIDIKEPVNKRRLSKETEEIKLTTNTKEIEQDKGNGEKVGSTKELVSTARPEDSTARPDVGSADPVAPPTTTNSSRLARSILTLKPLPTIDPKDKGKGVLEEPDPAKKMTRSDLDAAQIAKDAEVARLVYEEELAEVIDDFKTMDSNDAVDKEKVLEEPDSAKVKVKQEGDEESISKRPGRRLKMKATKKSKRVHTLTLEEGTEIYMLAERRYPLTKETLERMLDLRLIAEFESEDVFDLLRFIRKQIDESGSHDRSEKDLKELASPKQMDLGKYISNPLIVDSLLKTI